MAFLELNGKTYPLRLEYKEIRHIETIYNGRSFLEVIDNVSQQPSITDLEVLIYAAIANKDFSREEFADMLDAELSNEESEFSFVDLADKLMEAVQKSVFIKKLEAQPQQTQGQKTVALKAQKKKK